MSDYIYEIGNDFSSDKKEFVTLITERGQQIAVALGLGVIPHKGRYDDEKISFSYDTDYKESVNEILEKITSDTYAEQREIISAHNNGADCLFFIPKVAEILRISESMLRSRPLDIQIIVCKYYTAMWICDTYTLERELKAIFTLSKQIETTDSEKDIAVGKD